MADEPRSEHAKLRKLLAAMLKSDAEFDAFTLDYFPDVHRRFSGSMERLYKENLLLQLQESTKIEAALKIFQSTHPVGGPIAPGPPIDETDVSLPPWAARLLRGLSLRPRQAIYAFLLNYLGTSRQPVPFGGRAVDKQHLLSWVADGHAAPYLVLVAVTGRGKSALLCHVVATLTEQEDLDIVFLPVSLRFGLSLAGDAIVALLERWAALHDEAVPVRPDPAMVKALLTRALRRPVPDGRRLLVIMDGLDEANDWELESGLLPMDLPRGTKVLLSLRKTGEQDARYWRQRLGLGPRLVQGADLQLLRPSDILEALRSLALPGLSSEQEATLVDRLCYLSGGDPLVLGLLFEECQNASGLAELLAGKEVNLRPGLQGLWERMLKPSELDALSSESPLPTWSLIALLSCAQAPLPREDLIALAELPSGDVLDRALKPVYRWVMRTGDGYVFNHPGLRAFVWQEKLSEGERERTNACFVRWGERVLKELSIGACAPTGAPAYVLQWLSLHLQRQGASLDRWMLLLSNSWKKAWEARPLGYSGLLRDIELVWGAVAAANRQVGSRSDRVDDVPHLNELLRCSLWRASAASHTYNLELALLPNLVQNELLTPAQAIELLRRRSLQQKSSTQHPLSNELPALRKALLFLFDRCPEETVDLALSIIARDEWLMHEALFDLLPGLARRSPDLAPLYARRVRNPWLRIQALLKIAAMLPDSHLQQKQALQQEALRLIYALPHPNGFLNILSSVVKSLEPVDVDALLARALDIVREIEESSTRVWHLVGLLQLLASQEQRDSAFLAAVKSALACSEASELREVLGALSKISVPTAKDALSGIISSSRSDGIASWLLSNQASATDRWALLQDLLSPADRLRIERAALDAATRAWHTQWSAEPLQTLAELGLRDAALKVVHATADDQQRQVGLVRMAEYLSIEERLQVLGNELRLRRGRGARNTLAQLLHNLPAEQRKLARELLRGAADPLARTLGFLELRREASDPEKVELLSEIENAEKEVTDPDERIELLEHLFQLWPNEELLTELLAQNVQQTQRCGNSIAEELLLRKLARSLEEPHRTSVLQRLIELASAAPRHMRGRELDALLRYQKLPPPLRAQAIGLYRDVALGYEIGDLLPHLESNEERRSVLQRVLADAQRIHDESSRIRTAAALQPSESVCAELIRRAKAQATPEERFLSLADLSRQLPFHRDVALVEAIEAAQQLLFSERILARSFLLNRAQPDVLRTVIIRCLEQVLVLIAELAPILKYWARLSARDYEVAFHDLKFEKQRQVDKLRVLLRDIGSHLDAAQAQEVLAAIPWFWFDVISALLPTLPPDRQISLLTDSLRQARTLHGADRGNALAQLVIHLPESARSDGISEALSEAGTIVRPGWSTADNRLGVLWTVAPWLQPCHLARVLVLLCEDSTSVLSNLPGVIERVPAPLRPELVRRLYEAVRGKATPQANSLIIEIARFLEGEALVETIGRAKTTSYPQGMAELAGAIQQMDAQLLAEAFQRVRSASGRAQSSPHDPLLAAVGALAGELVRRAPEHQLSMLDYVEQMLRERGGQRTQLLDTIAGLAPLLVALTPPGRGDALAREVLDIEADWP
jgi:hypothetical protein